MPATTSSSRKHFFFDAKVLRRVAIAASIVFAATLTACNDSTDPEPEPEVETLRLTRGTQVVNIDVSTGVCTGCPLILSNGAVVTARFLAADGDDDPIATPGDFRLNVVIPTNTVGLAFTSNQANLFSGSFTATGTTATPFNVNFELFHIEENHDEFSLAVAVVVQ
jgi:hypothetical protein